MPLEPGTLVGPYKIVVLIGTGGMGEVYQARDTRLGREVALKVLPPERVAEPERRQRFLQEAQAASILNHPNIVAIYDIGSQDGFDFIAMEFVDGQTLDHLIPKGGMRVEQALRIAVPVADALARAHAAGIVHRDLKPGNVMVARDGPVKLVDFGLAKLGLRLGSGDDDSTRTALSSGAHTVEGRILGTVSYMSPEQAEGKKVDARSDIFSFGTLLYEMLTGERAFRGDSTLSTLSAILTLEPRPLRSIAPAIPPEIERVITRCIRKDPEKRWQNMTDIRVALAELKEETESGTLIAQRRPRAGATGGRTQWPLIAGALAGLALVLAGAWWLIRGAAPEEPEAVAVAEQALTDAAEGSAPGPLLAPEEPDAAAAPSAADERAAASAGAVPSVAPETPSVPAGLPAAAPRPPPKPRERAPGTLPAAVPPSHPLHPHPPRSRPGSCSPRERESSSPSPRRSGRRA